MIELWKFIEGYPNYQVSNTGKVFSIKSNRLLKPRMNERGYLKVSLTHNGKPRQYKIHRLVAAAFIPNPYNLPQVNHMDEDKTNNCVDNLEWCDNKYNHNYVKEIGTARYLYQYTISGELVYVWDCVSTAAESLNGYPSRISECAKGKTNTAYGYKWSYSPKNVFPFPDKYLK